MSDDRQRPDEIDEPVTRAGEESKASSDQAEKRGDVRATILKRRKLFIAAALAGFSAAGACDSQSSVCLSPKPPDDNGAGGAGGAGAGGTGPGGQGGAQACLSMMSGPGGQGGQGGQGAQGAQGGQGGTNQGGAGAASQGGGGAQVCLSPPKPRSPKARERPGRKGKS